VPNHVENRRLLLNEYLQSVPAGRSSPQGHPSAKDRRNQNGKTRRIPALEVMLRRLVNDAMRSDPNAIRLLVSLIDRYSDSPEAFNAKNVTGTVVILPSNGREILERKPE
jgi:hypothetical protein